MMLLGTCLLGLLPGRLLLLLAPPVPGQQVLLLGQARPRRRRPPRGPAATPPSRRGPAIISSFPGSSIWPFVLGMGAFILVLALVFGIWLLLPGGRPAS